MTGGLCDPVWQLLEEANKVKSTYLPGDIMLEVVTQLFLKHRFPFRQYHLERMMKGEGVPRCPVHAPLHKGEAVPVRCPGQRCIGRPASEAIVTLHY